MKMLIQTACVASRSRWSLTSGAGLLAFVAFVVGCGGAPPPNDKLAASEASIRGAEEVGAPNVPKAKLHLQLAQEQVAKAKDLIKDGDNEKAEVMLERAQADAELALALARESVTQAQAQQWVDQLKTVKGGK